MPLLVLAIAFTFFGPTNQAPNVDQEPSTQAPSSITPSIPADTTEQTVPVSNHHPIANNQTVTTEVNKPVDIALTALIQI